MCVSPPRLLMWLLLASPNRVAFTRHGTLAHGRRVLTLPQPHYFSYSSVRSFSRFGCRAQCVTILACLGRRSRSPHHYGREESARHTAEAEVSLLLLTVATSRSSSSNRACGGAMSAPQDSVSIRLRVARSKGVESAHAPSAPLTSSSWRRDAVMLVASSIAFLAMLCLLHMHSLSGGTGLRSARMRPAVTVQPQPANLTADLHTTTDLHTDDSSLHRHLLSADAAPAVDLRTPHLRAKSVNPWSPFRSEADQKARYKKWEVDFQVLLDKHKNPRPALEEWLSPAVAHLPINAARMHTVNQTVALLDGRMDPMFIFTLKHLFHMLGPNWGLIVFHTASNMEWWIDQLEIRPGGGGEHVVLQRVDPIAFQQANSLPASTVFYDRIPCETILIVQPDTMMLRSEYWPSGVVGGPTLEAMMAQFAYLGSPWGWCKEDWCRVAGNGGLSMRKRSVMLDLTREVRCTHWECHWIEMFEFFSHQQTIKWKHVEDTFFAYQLYDHAYKFAPGVSQLATPEQHAWFSLEGKDFPGVEPWFVHKVWNYMPHTRYGPLMAHTMQYYPELWMTKEELEVWRQETKTPPPSPKKKH